MKRISIFLCALVFGFSCSACGGQPESEDPVQGQKDDPVEAQQQTRQPENDAPAPEKIVLNGQRISWDDFPMPSAEVFALTGEDAAIYHAIAEVYHPKTYAATFSQSPVEVTDLSLPAFDVYEQVSDETGDTTYYGLFYQCDYYDLGDGLADLDHPVYDLHCGKSPAAVTVDADGNLVDFTQTYESSNDPDGDIRRVCGPMTDLADYFCGIAESYPKTPRRVPDMDPAEMLHQYLSVFFQDGD